MDSGLHKSQNGAKVPDNDPLMVAWSKFKETYEFANSKYWAAYMTIKQEEGKPVTIEHHHVDGALWGAFMAGFQASGGADAV